MDWMTHFADPGKEFLEAIEDGLRSYGEELSSFRYDGDGIIIVETNCEDRDSEVVEDIVFESLLEHFTDLHESAIDIEIDFGGAIEDGLDFDN
jgi:hypothetical protein